MRPWLYSVDANRCHGTKTVPDRCHETTVVKNATVMVFEEIYRLDWNGCQYRSVCDDELKGVPLSQGLFTVAEDSKQDICPGKCRKPGWRVQIALPSFLALRGHPLTPGTRVA